MGDRLAILVAAAAFGSAAAQRRRETVMNFLQNFWDVVWFFILTFAFVAYLMAIFSVIGDIFRDRSLNGWLKAVWMIFLIFVPFITVLVYVIARGEGMSRRTGEARSQARSETDQYIRAVAATSPADEIQKAKALLDSGTITSSEYENLKATALAEVTSSAPARDGTPLSPASA